MSDQSTDLDLLQLLSELIDIVEQLAERSATAELREHIKLTRQRVMEQK